MKSGRSSKQSYNTTTTTTADRSVRRPQCSRYTQQLTGRNSLKKRSEAGQGFPLTRNQLRSSALGVVDMRGSKHREGAVSARAREVASFVPYRAGRRRIPRSPPSRKVVAPVVTLGRRLPRVGSSADDLSLSNGRWPR